MPFIILYDFRCNSVVDIGRDKRYGGWQSRGHKESPTVSQISFIFMDFRNKAYQIIGFRPKLKGWRPPPSSKESLNVEKVFKISCKKPLPQIHLRGVRPLTTQMVWIFSVFNDS